MFIRKHAAKPLKIYRQHQHRNQPLLLLDPHLTVHAPCVQFKTSFPQLAHGGFVLRFLCALRSQMASLEQIGEEVVGQARCPFESGQSNVGLFAGESHDPCWMALGDLMLEMLVDMNNV